MLYDVVRWDLTELDDLSFLLHFVCASYEVDVFMYVDLCHAIFPGVLTMYFCELCAKCIKLAK